MKKSLTTLALLLTVLIANTSGASVINLSTATDLLAPSFRGDANTTYLGWDTFGAPGASIIGDITPDLGTDAGFFVTTNGEDHQSGSLNYYSSSGSVAEEVSFETDGFNGSGFTTVIVQAQTLFGPLGAEIVFSPIYGVAPSQVLQATNATGKGQLFARYELPGTADAKTFSISSGPQSMVSFGEFIIDTVWSPTSFARTSAVAVPEPGSAMLAMIGMLGTLGVVSFVTRRR